MCEVQKQLSLATKITLKIERAWFNSMPQDHKRATQFFVGAMLVESNQMIIDISTF